MAQPDAPGESSARLAQGLATDPAEVMRIVTGVINPRRGALPAG
jgi:hypothetical protein